MRFWVVWHRGSVKFVLLSLLQYQFFPSFQPGRFGSGFLRDAGGSKVEADAVWFGFSVC